MQRIIFAVLLLAAFGGFAWTLSRFIRVMLRGRKFEGTFENKTARFGDVLLYFLFQRSVAREWASRHHLLIFWGFLVITVGTAELMVKGVFPGFSYSMIMGQTLDHLFKTVLDLTNLVVLVVMGWAVFRRIVIRPKLIPMSFDAALILGMIAMLCVTHFLMHGYGMLAATVVHDHLPVSAFLARRLDAGVETAALVSQVNFWIHMVIVLFFLNYIPYSKHIHLLGALPNIALRNRGQKGIMPRLDLEDETRWGASVYERFDWKSLLDTYACTECARCSTNCPAYNTDKPLSPMHLIHDLRDEMRERGGHLVQLSPGLDPTAGEEQGEGDAKKVEPTPQDKQILKQLEQMPPMVGGRITDETLWACTTCGACEAVCPVFIEHPLKILQMRTHLVLAESRMPAELARMFRGIENNMNPWGIGSDQRMDWAAGLEVPTLEEKGSAEYLVWIGCAGAFDDRAKKLSRTWVQLLQRAGVDFAILGLEEGCTGDPARRAGNEFLFQMMAESNIETLNNYKVKKILVTCPHCYHSFKNEYSQFGGNYEVQHHTQFIRKLLAEGKLKPSREIDGVMTYHDSCYLGRWNEIYREPRDVLARISGGRQPVEMARTGYKSFCCGAGGARMWMEEDAPRVNVVRTEEALGTGARTIATACPFCMVMLTDGIKAKDKDEEVRVMDIAELVFEALPPAPQKTAQPPDTAEKEAAQDA